VPMACVLLRCILSGAADHPLLTPHLNGGRLAMINKGTLGGDAPDNIFGGQYRRQSDIDATRLARTTSGASCQAISADQAHCVRASRAQRCRRPGEYDPADRQGTQQYYLSRRPRMPLRPLINCHQLKYLDVTLPEREYEHYLSKYYKNIKILVKI
jgi:hypothetical protein